MIMAKKFKFKIKMKWQHSHRTTLFVKHLVTAIIVSPENFEMNT